MSNVYLGDSLYTLVNGNSIYRLKRTMNISRYMLKSQIEI